ncbi:AcvB/VirJ family lysyl-phosphatidylglycerol hydrolase [Amaricoccus sp.]|uniref:virulence factor family protein n=1 Tax=Amaricoccus sp. TaxID=1872485 RepID=UPI00260AB30F|nr:AcvB/VirJ family lysyl-phosphatidylglycerol hydrolase [Amaricoccus sp.]HRO09887.1 AcvB/VirJ family lysyl-phosphatidylglycerol hydrolase [Amaricoccus sp.]
MFRACLAAALFLSAVPSGPAACAAGPGGSLDGGQIPDPVVLAPSGPAVATVVLFSGGGGWSDSDAAVAKRLQGAGAAVIGIDLPAYLAALDGEGKDCVYLVADFERLGHVVERQSGATTFHAPIVAGGGAGGALALDILAQTPADTLGGAVVVDPAAGAPLATALCTSAARHEGPAGSAYALPAGAPPAPLTLVLTDAAPPDAAARADAMAAAGTVFARRTAAGPAAAALGDALLDTIARQADTGDAPAIVELPAAAAHDTMAIMISGDGGWRDLDRSVAGVLQEKGVPTVGLDALRWFWTARTPEETATEIARLIEVYSERWNVGHVVLAGYSFGAGVLPAAYAELPAEAREKVVQLSLLAPAVTADWQITVAGWLGSASSDAAPVGPALARLPPPLVQCFYGREERDSACPGIAASGAEIIETTGGHHFDGDYRTLAGRILDGIEDRLAERRAAAAQSSRKARVK